MGIDAQQAAGVCANPDIGIAISGDGQHLEMIQLRRYACRRKRVAIPAHDAVIRADPQSAARVRKKTIHFRIGQTFFDGGDLTAGQAKESGVAGAHPYFAVGHWAKEITGGRGKSVAGTSGRKPALPKPYTPKPIFESRSSPRLLRPMAETRVEGCGSEGGSPNTP